MSWNNIRYFKKDSKIDNYGDVDKIYLPCLEKIDDLRHFLGKPIYITSGFRPDEKSEHSRTAFDIVCPGVSLLDLYLAAERLEFTGIGVYPYWSFKGQKVGGLHVDERPVVFGARWMGVLVDQTNLKSRKQRYIALNKRNLVRHGVLR